MVALLLCGCGKTCTEFSGTYIPHDVRSLPRNGTYQFEDCTSCPKSFALDEVVVNGDSTIVKTFITTSGDTSVYTMKLVRIKEKTLYEKTY